MTLTSKTILALLPEECEVKLLLGLVEKELRHVDLLRPT
jgi:hypothetical protein